MLEIYNYATSTWSPLPSMANTRGNIPHMFMLGMLVLGVTASPNDKVVEELDMTSDQMSWAQIDDQLKKGRNSAGAAAVPFSKFCN